MNNEEIILKMAKAVFRELNMYMDYEYLINEAEELIRKTYDLIEIMQKTRQPIPRNFKTLPIIIKTSMSIKFYNLVKKYSKILKEDLQKYSTFSQNNENNQDKIDEELKKCLVKRLAEM